MADLVSSFVEGKVQQRFHELSAAMEEFFRINQPIIEDVYLFTKILQKKTIFNLKEEDIENSWRKDYEGAVKGLSSYNRIFGRVDNALAIMSSNFRLRSFLAENGVSFDAVGDVQTELNEYWAATYGDLIMRWSVVKHKLECLRDILAKEVKMLEQIPNRSLFVGLKEYPPLVELFYQEREMFYDVMRTYTEMHRALLSQTLAKFEIALRKAQHELLAMKKCLEKQLDGELALAKTRTQKSIIVLFYFAGIFKVIKGMQWRIMAKGIVMIALPFFRSKEEKAESKTNALLSRKGDAEQIMGDTISDTGQLITLIDRLVHILA